MFSSFRHFSPFHGLRRTPWWSRLLGTHQLVHPASRLGPLGPRRRSSWWNQAKASEAARSPWSLVAVGTLLWLFLRWLGAERYDLHGRVVLITGGSRGLGLVMARRLVGAGARVCLLARDAGELHAAEQELNALANDGRGRVLTVRADVADEAEVRAAVEQTVAHFGGLDVLINNAGIIQVGPVVDLSRADFEEAMNVNFWGALHAIRQAYPHLRQQPGARIVNVTSVGGVTGIPHMAAYCASKHALVGLSDVLRAELRAEGLRVVNVVPSVLRTGSHLSATFKGRTGEEFAWFAGSTASPLTAMRAEAAAREIITALRRGQAYQAVGLQARLSQVLRALFPNSWLFGATVANGFLPRPAGGPDQGLGDRGSGPAQPGRTARHQPGAQSVGPLLRPADEAAVRNRNERRSD